MAERKIRNLNPEEIECRVGNVMEQGITLLLYKNARVDQTILDEVFGICGWQRRHNMIGSELYCILSIWDDEKQQWVQKEDVGTESDYEKAKGAASDSFKRTMLMLKQLKIGESVAVGNLEFSGRHMNRPIVIKTNYKEKLAPSIRRL